MTIPAEVSNVPLIGALLERGADITQTDVFGRTLYLLALDRAFQDAGYAAHTLGSVDERVRPQVLDVLVGDRLVRLPSGSAEFYFLSVMLAALPIFGSSLHEQRPSSEELTNRQAGFFVDALRVHLEHFPLSVLREGRRKRSYFNHVLARTEMNSGYQSARRLWKRSQMGFYLLNPDLKVRLKMTPGDRSEWTSVALLTDPVARAWLAGHSEA